jgi:hypothetical protein
MTKTNPDESDEGPMVGDAELRIYIAMGLGGLQARACCPIASSSPHTTEVIQSHALRYKQTKQLSITWIT